MRRVVLSLLAVLSLACSDVTTDPDGRSAFPDLRSGNAAGKQVWDTYELVVDYQSGVLTPPVIDYSDTLRFDTSGEFIAGGPWQPYDADRYPPLRIEPYPLEKGATASFLIVTWRGNIWMSAPEPFMSKPCSRTEQNLKAIIDPMANWDCAYADQIRYELFTGVVQPNGAVVGTVESQLELGEQRLGTFTLSPIRGRRDVEVEPVVTYDSLVTTRLLEVYTYTGNPDPYPYQFNVQAMVAAFGSDWMTITTDEEFLSFTAPEGCMRVGPELHCTAATVFPAAIIITILPGAQWYESATGDPVVADFTGREITANIVVTGTP